MLPVRTAQDHEASVARGQRRDSAVRALDTLELWIAGERPDLKLPVGNLPRFWAALAMKDSLDAHVQLARLAGQAPEPREVLPARDWRAEQSRLTALERFYRQYQANLHAV